MSTSRDPKAGDMDPEEQPLNEKEKRGLQLPKTTTVNGKKQAIPVPRHGQLVIKPGEVWICSMMAGSS